MPVATMEELAALPAGTRVRVNSRALGLQEWTVAANGLEREGVTIDVGNFVGAVAAGQVARAEGPLIQQGDLFEHAGWTSDRYTYLVVGVDDEAPEWPRGRVWIAEFRSHEFRTITHLEPRTISEHRRGANQDPDWLRPFRRLVTPLYEAQREVERLRGEVNTLTTQQAAAPVIPTPLSVTVPESLVNDLREFAAVVNDPSFDALLTNHSIGRGVRFSVDIVIDGHSRWMPQVDQVNAMNAMGNTEYTIAAASGEPILVTWRRQVRVEAYGTGGCACAAVTRDDLLSYLPPQWEDWSFEARTCTPA